MVTVEEIKRVGVKHTLREPTPLVRLFFRKYSFHFAWFFLKLGMTANQVSAFGFIIGILGTIFFISNNYILFMAGSIFLFVSIIADCADGTVARYRKYKNLPSEPFRKYGGFMDSLLNFPRAFVIICLSISFINYAHPFLILSIGFLSAGFCYMDVGLNGLLESVFHKRIVSRNSNLAQNIRIVTYDQITLPIFLFTTALIDFIFGTRTTFYYWLYMAVCGVILFTLEIYGKKKK